MRDWRIDRVGSCERGENPMVIARMRSGFAVMGDTQFQPGYCLLLASPQVAKLEDLPPAERAIFLEDMGTLGAARERGVSSRASQLCDLRQHGCLSSRHVFPRYVWEDPERARRSVWLYPQENWSDADKAYTAEKHGALRVAITAALGHAQKDCTSSSIYRVARDNVLRS